jgi:hypothetical protein
MKSCCAQSGPEPRKIPAAEVGRTLQTKIDGADAARAAQLGGLQRLRQAKGAMLAREQARLSRTLGPKHPQVVALSQKIAVNQNLAVQVVRAQSRAQASVPQADANTWIVHGHVRTKDLKPVQQATVALYTCDGQWLRQFGYDCTDADGHFKLVARSNNQVGQVSAGVGTVQEAVSVKTAQPAADVSTPQGSADMQAVQSGAVGGTASAEDGRMCLRVTDSKQTVLGGDTSPLTLQPGRVDYREIILDGEVCAPPPEGSPAPGPQGDPGTINKTQFLGNSHNREVHDLKNTKKNCRIDQISADHRVFFKTAEDAIKAGYDYCAYCFGKAKSKR